MIHIKNLKKLYSTKNRTVAAINDINLQFPDKGMVFIVGKSGSGKSTLLNILSGFDKPTSGQIIIGNKNIIEFSNEEMDNYRASCLGFVFQDFHLLENLSVKDNIKMALSIKSEKDDELVSSILEQVGLKGYETRRISELSGGECQRIAIARSLVKNPHIILADEPTGNLDSKTSTQILDILKSISKNNLVVIVSHNLQDAYNYGDRIIELKDGDILDDKVREENYCNEFKIEDGCVTIPYKKEINSKQLDEFKEAIERNEVKEIVQLNDGFNKVTYSDDFKEKEIPFKKSKLLISEFNQLSTKFLKRQKLLTTMTVILTTLLITLFGIIQSFMMFDTKAVINSFSDDYANTPLVLYKGEYDDYNRYLTQSYLVKTEDSDVQDIIDAGFEGNIYKLYTYALPISNSYNALVYVDKSYANTNFTNFYIQESLGTLVTDEDYLIRVFGNDGNLEVLAGDLNAENGLIITDYLADSILYYQAKNFSSYEDIIGDYTLNNANCANIKAIIKTNYKEKYGSLLEDYKDLGKIDSKLTKKEFLNSKSFKSFMSDASKNLGVMYSFDEDFVNKQVESNSKQLVRLGNSSVSYNNKVISSNAKFIFHLDTMEEITLNDNEIILSYTKYNEIFGTKYTYQNYATDFVPHKIVLTKYNDAKDINMIQEFEKELKIVKLSNGSISNAICNKNLFNYMQNYEIFSYNLYLDEVSDLGSLYNAIESNYYYVNIESYNAIKYISNVIINFQNFFSLIMGFVIILSIIVVAFFANSILNKNKKNIGIMRALGMRNLDIIRIFALQIFYMSLVIIALSFVSYFVFVSIGNEILIDTFTNLQRSPIIKELTLISPNLTSIITDLIITILVSSLTILVQMNLLKRIDVINIIKPKE